MFLCNPSDGNRESEVVFREMFLRLRFFHLHGYGVTGVTGAVVERKFALRSVGRKFTPSRTISLEAVVQFTTPFEIRGRVERQIPVDI
jgi:hypothetical protein